MAATSVYLDYNATTPMDPDVLSAVTVSLKEDWNNPSSGYPGGESIILLASCRVLYSQCMWLNMMSWSSPVVVMLLYRSES